MFSFLYLSFKTTWQYIMCLSMINVSLMVSENVKYYNFIITITPICHKLISFQVSYLIKITSSKVHFNHNYENFDRKYLKTDNKHLNFEIYKAEVTAMKLEHLKQFLNIINPSVISENSTSSVIKTFTKPTTFFEDNIVSSSASQYILPNFNVSFNHSKITSDNSGR